MIAAVPVSPSPTGFLLRESFKRCLNTITWQTRFWVRPLSWPSLQSSWQCSWLSCTVKTYWEQGEPVRARGHHHILRALAPCSPSPEVFSLKQGQVSTTTFRSSLTNPMLEPEQPSSGQAQDVTFKAPRNS
jgi:hypothetical protein